MWTALVVTATLVAQAGSAAKPDELAAQVRELAVQLDSATVADRDAAEKKLIELGPAALDHLPRIVARTSPEMKQRLGRVRAALELTYAKSAAQASQVTLIGEYPLSQALAAIEKQTGNKIVDLRRHDPRPDPRLKLSLKDAPFWEAVDEVFDQARLTVEPQPQGDEGQPLAAVGAIDRLPGHVPRRPRAIYHGPLRLEVSGISARRDFVNPRASSMKLDLAVAWEPRLAPIALLQAASDITAIDDQGRKIEVGNDAESLEAPVSPGTQAKQIQISLDLPASDAKKIASLKGKLAVLVPGRMQTFRFTRLASRKPEDVEQSRGDVTVKIAQAARNNELLSVRVHVLYGDPQEAVQSHYGWIYENRARLEGSDGKPIRAAGFESDGIEGGVEAAYYFDVEGDPDKFTFVYETPAVILKVPVEYELRNIERP